MTGFHFTSSCSARSGVQERASVVANVATPTRPPASRTAKRGKVELIKEHSDYLRHPLMSDLVDENTFISEEAMQLMKFHGSYQQDHREKRAFGQGKFYQFMMRTRQPGGIVSNQLYLAMDDLSEMVRLCVRMFVFAQLLVAWPLCALYRGRQLVAHIAEQAGLPSLSSASLCPVFRPMNAVHTFNGLPRVALLCQSSRRRSGNLSSTAAANDDVVSWHAHACSTEPALNTRPLCAAPCRKIQNGRMLL